MSLFVPAVSGLAGFSLGHYVLRASVAATTGGRVKLGRPCLFAQAVEVEDALVVNGTQGGAVSLDPGDGGDGRSEPVAFVVCEGDRGSKERPEVEVGAAGTTASRTGL